MPPEQPPEPGRKSDSSDTDQTLPIPAVGLPAGFRISSASEPKEQSLTAAADILGTPGHLAPEQATDAKGVGKPADVFGMGTTLYKLIAGQPPFQGETAMQAILATLNTPHLPIKRFCPEISPPTAALLDACLEKDPAHRFPDGAALLQALRLCREALGKSLAIQQRTIQQLKQLESRHSDRPPEELSEVRVLLKELQERRLAASRSPPTVQAVPVIPVLPAIPVVPMASVISRNTASAAALPAFPKS